MTRSGAVRTLVLLAGLAVLSVGLQPAAASAASAGASSSRWTRHGPEGGSAAAIVVSPSRPRTLYAIDGGQIFRSTNGGGVWSYRSSPPGSSGPGLAVDPTDPSILYLEADSGLIKSTDGGTTWTQTSFTGTLPSTATILVDPQNPGSIYIGITDGYTEPDSGVWRSTDGGSTWDRVLTVSRLYALAMDPGTPQDLYATTANHVYRTTNGGTTWTHTTTDTKMGSLVVADQTPVALYGIRFVDGILHVSLDGGATWQPADQGMPTTVRSLVVDPGNPRTLYAASTAPGYGSLGAVYKSTDAGGSWAVTGLQDTGSEASGVGALAIDPVTPSTLYAGAGVALPPIVKTTDGGTTWFDSGSGFTVSWISALAGAPSNPGTTYAVDPSMGVARSADDGVTWSAPVRPPGWVGGTSPGLAVDPADANVVYVNDAAYGYRSSDGGRTWSRSSGLPFFVSEFAVDPADPDRLFAAAYTSGGSPIVYESNDAGANFQPVADSVVPEETIPTALLLDPNRPRTMYVALWGAGKPGDTTNGIYKSSDGGGSWRFQNEGLPPGVHVTSLAIHPTSTDTLYAGTADSGVFKTTDGGASWSASSDGMGGVLVNDVVVDPAAPKTVYATVPSAGAFRSKDGGRTWRTWNGGLDNLNAGPISVDQNGAFVHVGILFYGVYDRAATSSGVGGGT